MITAHAERGKRNEQTKTGNNNLDSRIASAGCDDDEREDNMTYEKAIEELERFVAVKTTQRPAFADIAVDAIKKQIRFRGCGSAVSRKVNQGWKVMPITMTCSVFKEYDRCPECDGRLAVMTKEKSDGQPLFKQACYICGFESDFLILLSKAGKRRTCGKSGEWSRDIKQIFGNRCIICGSEENLEAHHIIPVSIDSTYEYDLNNGVCLCKSCHNKAHQKTTHTGYGECYGNKNY